MPVDSTVQVALISGVCGVLAASIPAAISGRRRDRRTNKLAERTDEIADRIGDPNGAGNVVQMLSTLLEVSGSLQRGQAGQDRRIAALEARQHETVVRVDRLAGRVDALEQIHHNGR